LFSFSLAFQLFTVFVLVDAFTYLLIVFIALREEGGVAGGDAAGVGTVLLETAE